MTGASTGELDDDLAEAEAIAWRAPYQSSARLRAQINSGIVEFVDMHERCAHPAYRPYLRAYLARARVGHIRHDLATCFELHRDLIETGQMLPEIDVAALAQTM